MKYRYRITSLSDLIDIIKELPADKTFWFRGHYDKDWPLVPSVQRDCYADQEQALANDFYMRASVTLPESCICWESRFHISIRMRRILRRS